MTADSILDLFAYTDWANDLVLASAAALAPEQWRRDLGSSFPSVGATLAHLVGAERIWLRRWMDQPPGGRPAWIDDPTPEVVRAELTVVQQDRRAFLAALTDGHLARPSTFTLLNGYTNTHPLRDLMVHAANHSTYHRGQVTAMLRQLGMQPPSTDYLLFCGLRDAPAGSAA
jgi:uncharacterized damage-inducible protein DinB